MKILLTSGRYLTMTGYVLFALFPLYWLLKMAITPEKLIYTQVTDLWPSRLTRHNFHSVIFASDFLTYFRNSVFVSLVSAGFTTPIAGAAGYAFSRFRFRGEFIVLVGPSGCGKSTLLRMIAGLESISAGEIRMDGKRINELPPRDRDIAMVFQSYALYPHMDVSRNMGFSMEIQGKEESARRGKISQAAEVLGLDKLLERLPRALSGGQRQRVAMGRAIVRDPSAFLFDEPLSNLEAALRVEMRLELAKLHQRLGTTMVYVTHDQVEALTLADRIVVLDAGVVQQVGTPMELYEKPANLFVARFIGSPTMNLMDASVQNQQLLLGDSAYRLDASRFTCVDSVRQMGIRQEHLSPVNPGTGHLQGTVEVVERLGSDSFIYAQVPGAGRLSCRCSGNTELEPDAPLGLQLDLSHLHLFNETGQSLISNAF